MHAPSLLVVVLLPLLAANARGAHWETVISEDGKFSVEMPETPNFRSNRAGGGRSGAAQVVGKGYRSATQSYIVQRADSPPNVVLGSDDSRLDSQRDELARQYQGKPTGEKKIQLEGGGPGREFTIHGRLRGETGLAMVRVREYVVGKSVYALIVTSTVDGTLPEETDRFLDSLKLISGGASKPEAAAAPVPPRGRTATSSGAAESAIAGWGTAIDPDRDCTIHPEGQALVIDLPNKPHDLTPFSGLFNVPRVVREVEGDFDVQVKIEGTFKPIGPAERLVDEPTNGAGLILLGDGQSHIILDRMSFIRKERHIDTVEFAQRGSGGNRGRRNPQLATVANYLRLARKGKQVLASVSSDGKEWKSMEALESQLPDRLKVGVVAINTSKAPFSVTFSDFKLEVK